MVKYKNAHLDAVFAALSDATRRAAVEQLSGGTQTVTELAEPHGMSLPGFMKHLRVLEDAGLVVRYKQGRVVHCSLATAPMDETAAWLARYTTFWSEQLDALGRYLELQEESTQCPPKSPRSSTKSSSPARTKPRRRKSGARGPVPKR